MLSRLESRDFEKFEIFECVVYSSAGTIPQNQESFNTIPFAVGEMNWNRNQKTIPLQFIL